MRLRVIYTGGTVGCDGHPLVPMPAEAFRALWETHVAPGLAPGFEIGWQWSDRPLDSSAMTPQDWVRLARMVLAAEDADGVVLLHGTDTMAWTAAALALTLTLYDEAGAPAARFGKPVVLTGAQRPLFEGGALRAGTDALDNIRTAVSACATGRPEVIVAFGSLILRGTRVMKMSTTDDRAFGYPNGAAPCPALEAAAPEALSAQFDRLAPHLGRKAVVTLTPGPAEPTHLAAQVEGIVDRLGPDLGAFHLLGFGIGNFPAEEALKPLLTAAHAAGALIVAGTQVPHGPVAPATYGAGHWLTGCGAMASADMTPAAVQAKLHVALALAAANGWDQDRTQRFFLTPVAGELRG
jgi:L-asparaginase